VTAGQPSMMGSHSEGQLLPSAVARWRPRVRRIPLSLYISGGVLVLLILVGVLAPILAPYNPLRIDVLARLQGPSSTHLLGTDAIGRDVLSRLLYGDTSALLGVVIALGVAGIAGITWGLAAGVSEGIFGEILMRLTDVLLSFPGIVLAVAVTGVLGPSLNHAMISVGVVFAPVIARIMRSAILPIRRSAYLVIARSLGTSTLRVTLRHVMPNAMAPVVVQLCSLASIMILIEAALSFLGLGAQPPAPSWGADLALAYGNFTQAPLLTIAPGLAIVIGAFTLSVVGDGLRKTLRID
jgi:peptide/nickel transport system permease protein